ncbi:RNB domain-containing ribonuclease [Gordonia aichiensis]|uniref:RNB domain-containing ribonuclease n=1 Tax=Gordonia aichiensis TaxID=36820 RepID=UPI003267A7AA
MPALMIDDASTVDRDDAITVTPCADGWDAAVHIAAVADLVPIGSDADRQALTRIVTRYLRAGTKPMLGRDLEDATTLTATDTRPTLTVRMRFTAAGELTDSSLGREHLEAGDCVAYTHKRVSQALTDTADPEHEHLTAAYALARTLFARRRAAGAFAIFDTTRGMVTTEDGQLVALRRGQTADAYLIVQELMVAANATIATWAIDSDQPILFRNHRRAAVAPAAQELLADVAAEIDSAAELAGDQLEALATRVNQTLRPATYAPVAHSHYGLQIPAYCHATSPLRRYPDLVTQRVVLAALDGAPQPYDLDQLDDIASTANTTIRQIKDNTAKSASASRRQQAASTISRGDYSHAQGRDWLRILRVAAGSALPATLAAEIIARADRGEIDGGQLATIVDADGNGWAPVVEHAITRTRELAPQYGPSVVSAWRQLTSADQDAPRIESVSEGPPHRPTFAVRVRVADRVSRWATGESKKAAEQEAMWDIVDIIAGRRESADPQQLPPFDATSTAASGTATLPAMANREWLRLLRTVTTGALDDDVAAEVRRRANLGALDGPMIAALLTGHSEAWRGLLADVITAMRERAPHVANSVLAAWAQGREGQPSAPTMHTRRSGPAHASTFAISAELHPWVGQWHTASTKKDAEQQAVWDIVGLIGGIESEPAPLEEPSETPQAEALPSTVPADGLTHRIAATSLPSPRPRKIPKNPAMVVAAAPPLPFVHGLCCKNREA